MLIHSVCICVCVHALAGMRQHCARIWFSHSSRLRCWQKQSTKTEHYRSRVQFPAHRISMMPFWGTTDWNLCCYSAAGSSVCLPDIFNTFQQSCTTSRRWFWLLVILAFHCQKISSKYSHSSFSMMQRLSVRNPIVEQQVSCQSIVLVATSQPEMDQNGITTGPNQTLPTAF